jgi:pyruvate kinase
MSKLINKTKIVATLGPASSDKETLLEMARNGMNVCRLNLSHGKHEDLEKVIHTIREINLENNSHISILADLQGPKIRTGEVQGGSVQLASGSKIKFVVKKQLTNSETIFINYKNFLNDVQKGERVLIDDGKLVLEILDVDDTFAEAMVLFGGPLSSRKGVNLPNTKLSIPSLTPKDLIDLEFALKMDVRWIGLSFVRTANDVLHLKELIHEAGKDSKVIAKIEKPEAVADMDAIIDATDGIMVARGDLGVEIPMQDVPLIQKALVKKARKKFKPVIIATQMMESMITNISPTRAEVNDVANAVMDGADAVMLSGETSVGDHPIEVIRAMYKIVTRTEEYKGIYFKDIKVRHSEERFVSDAICKSAVELAQNSEAKGIVTMTFSGYTTFRVASYRPNCLIFVFTSNQKILDMLSLVWGVRGFYYNKFVSTDHTIEDVRKSLKKSGYVVDGDYVIHVASMPISDKGSSNMLKLSLVH